MAHPLQVQLNRLWRETDDARKNLHMVWPDPEARRNAEADLLEALHAIDRLRQRMVEDLDIPEDEDDPP